ncbi:Gfo/Idh/MocA family protein [Anaerosolibacter carboniphilus]|nr:Gfo/Idh/MocA family oxidoreductase [Anaerosolibacter carboniphilus]
MYNFYIHSKQNKYFISQNIKYDWGILMMKKFKAGVVGIGFIGVAHIEALRRLGNVEVLALTNETDPVQKAAHLNVPHGFADYREMIDTVDLDMIHICTPNHTHYEIATYAMERGIHVLCEKPMTTTVEEAEKLVQLAKEKQLVHAINYHNRFYPITHHLRQMAKEAEFGEIFSIHGGYIQDWLLFDTDFNWRLISSKSGKTRAVADIGSHWLDLIEYMTGLKIVEVFAAFRTFYDTRKRSIHPVETFSQAQQPREAYEDIPIDTEDFASILLKFDNGALGNTTISQMFAGEKNRISVFIGGSKMSAQWDSNDISNLVIGRRDEPNLVLTKDPGLLHPQSAKITGYPGGHVEGFPDAFKQTFKQIYASIEDPTMEKEYATFEDGLRQMILCERIYESAQTNRWVKI